MTNRNPAVDMLLADLRDELVAAPDATRAEAHVHKMQLEQQLLAPARPTANLRTARTIRSDAPRLPLKVRIRHTAISRPRRAVALVAAICVLSATVGLNAAGALPGAIRHVEDHVTNAIVHTFGVPQAPKPRADGHTPNGGTTNLPGATTTTSGSGSRSGGSNVTDGAAGSTLLPSGTQSGTSPVKAEGGGSSSKHAPSGTPTDPTPPNKKPWHKDTGKNGNAPPGYPSDWQTRAIAAARADFATCTQATTLTPADCPQEADPVGVIPNPGTVQWAMLIQPLAGATVVATKTDASAPPAAQSLQISVYGQFQMYAGFTVGSDTTPLYAYSGGIALATMVWNGSSYQDVTFATGPVTTLPSGVDVPGFAAPPGVTYDAVLASLQAGFAACAVNAPVPVADITDCPQGGALPSGVTTAQWSLVGDPLQDAVVGFDSQHGDFTVTGTYEMTMTTADPLASSGTTTTDITGSYSATLAFDGNTLQLIDISGSS